jgi:peroxiredoxin/outer membrane lipoprotein-sorting protein
MMRRLLFAAFLAGPLAAQEPSAQEVLSKLRSAYGALTGLHVVAERRESDFVNGRPITATSECEFAVKTGHRYFARLKEIYREAIAVSDGNTTWKALPGNKEWAQVAAAESSQGESMEGWKQANADLRGAMERMAFGQYVAVAKLAEDPVIVKEEDYKLAGKKVRGYLIRAHIGKDQHELLVDQQRFLVLHYKQKTETAQGLIEITVNIKMIELNTDVDDSLFHFSAAPGWKEAESLTLPGEVLVVSIGAPAPKLSLKTLEGELVNLERLHGRVIVLDFWATWCGPCREEMPRMEKLRAEFGEAVQFYGVNDEESKTVRDFLKKNHYEIPLLMDPQREAHRSYGIHAIPTLFIIDGNSVVRHHIVGSATEAKLRNAIESVLNSSKGGA